MSSAPFFIVGSGRSGTTLLRMILASHSHLSIPPETWYLLRLPEAIKSHRPLSPSEIDDVIATMTRHYRWPDMNYDAREFRQDAARLVAPQLRDVVELIYRKQLERDGKLRWGDKTPGYIAILPRLADLFPGAQFIHFIRDGRDVAKSFQSKRWEGRWLHDNAREWIEAMEFEARWMSTGLARQILRVRYEDLVLQTEGTVRRICSFLGEQYEPTMLDWQTIADRLVPAREAHIHEKLKQTPDSSDVYRWKRELSARELFVCEAFMARHLLSHGYELYFQSPSWRPLFALTRLYCLTVLPVLAVPLRAVRWLRQRLLHRGAESLQPDAGDHS